MSDIEYEFKPSKSGHTVWIKLKTPGLNDTCSWAVTYREFAQFLEAASDASTSAALKRIAQNPVRQTPPPPINSYYYIAPGGGGGNGMSTDRVVGGYPGGGGGETIESLERRRRLMQYYHYPLNKRRPRRIVNRVTPRGIR